MTTDDTTIDELLGAYALDAVEPAEAAAVEEYIERAPSAASELARLRNAAAAIGATEAFAPPPELLDSVLSAARTRRPAHTDDPFLAVYLSETARYDALLDTVPADALDVLTDNGLTVHELIIHLAAMESAVAAAIGRPTAPDMTDEDIERRTSAFVARFRGRPLREVRTLWRASVNELAQWSQHASAGKRVHVFGLPFPRESNLVSRAFETWTHADDIRRALGRQLSPPEPEVLHRMANLSVTTVPASLEMLERAHRGKTAR